jgi:hypothetical protein
MQVKKLIPALDHIEWRLKCDEMTVVDVRDCMGSSDDDIFVPNRLVASLPALPSLLALPDSHMFNRQACKSN